MAVEVEQEGGGVLVGFLNDQGGVAGAVVVHDLLAGVVGDEEGAGGGAGGVVEKGSVGVGFDTEGLIGDWRLVAGDDGVGQRVCGTAGEVPDGGDVKHHEQQ